VRSAIRIILASLAPLVLAAALAAPAGAAAKPEVTIALLPQGTSLSKVGSAKGLSLGFLSAGIGRVPAAQTYLDITQGNRVSESLYEGDLPLVRFGSGGVAPRDWATITQRAETAPADVSPGLLASTLERAGLEAQAERGARLGALLAANEAGRIAPLPAKDCAPGRCGALRVLEADPAELEALVDAVAGDDLLIAIERPPPAFRTLTIGVAGPGFDGLLTSDSTRTDGLVATTDIAPTVLERLGVAAPAEMNGEPIRGGAEGELEGLLEFGRRLEVTGERRGPVIGQTLAIWAALALIAVAIGPRAAAPSAVRLLALSLIYLPLVLLITPAFDPSLAAERLAAGLGAPLLALLTLAVLPGWRALALACLATVAAYGIDVLAGSVLVPLSIPGPNPASGSRFFGIGNEIEATVAALLPLGIGALLAAIPAARGGGIAAAAAFLAAALLATGVFALGRFGADVGAAIVLPAGGAVAAAIALGTRRGLLLVLLVPIAALAVLMAADLLLGGEAHLTRSLLDAGGFAEAADVFERRVRLAATSFTRTANLPFLALAVVVIGLGIWRRREVIAWLGPRAALAGFGGAAAATLVGTVSNDSGVILLILGTAYCTAAAGYAWALR
jgi:hypothetical protein